MENVERFKAAYTWIFTALAVLSSFPAVQASALGHKVCDSGAVLQPRVWTITDGSRISLSLRMNEDGGNGVPLPKFRCDEGARGQSPALKIRVAVPPRGEIRVRALQAEIQPSGLGRSGAPARAADPADFYRVEGFGWFRYLRFVTLSVRPWKAPSVSGRGGAMLISLDLVIEGGHMSGPPVRDPLAAPLYRALVVNPGDAPKWLARPPAPATRRPVRRVVFPLPASTYGGGSVNATFSIPVDRDGLYRITYDDLAGQGLIHPAYSPSHFSLWDPENRRVGMEFIGDGDNQIEPGEYFLFYGEAYEPPPERSNEFQHGRYTRTNVYRLKLTPSNPVFPTIDGTPNRGYPVLDYFTEDRKFEVDQSFFSGSPTGNDDHWYWMWLYYTAPDTGVVDLTGLDLSATGETVDLEVGVLGVTSDPGADPDHHLRITQESVQPPAVLFDSYFDGFQRVTLQGVQPLDRFVPGSNTLRFETVDDLNLNQDVVLVDWVRVKYPRTFTAVDGTLTAGVPAGHHRLLVDGFRSSDITVLDVTDPLKPRRIIGGTVSPSGSGYAILLDLSLAADTKILFLDSDAILPIAGLTPVMTEDPPFNEPFDYLVITHRDLARYPSIQQLTAHRESQGLKTAVVTVEDIMEWYRGGVFDPEAVHEFLQDVFNQVSPPAPLYVVFIGDTTFDYLDAYGNPDYEPGQTPITPTWFVDYPGLGEAFFPNDFLFTRVAGDDEIPDMVAGRISVRTRRELGDVVAKLLAYDNAGSGDWTRRVVMIADEPRDGTEDVFETVHDAMYDEYFTDPAYNPYLVDRIYHRVCCPGDPGLMHDAVVAAWNAGAAVMSFAGHGAHEFWGYTPFLDSTDPNLLNDLVPADGLPFTVNVSCRTGSFHKSIPGTTFWDAFMETFLKLPRRGVEAAMAPSAVDDVVTVGSTLPLFYEAMFHPLYRYRRVGDVAFYVWSRLISLSALKDAQNLDLFGDPAAMLRLPSIDAPLNLTATGGEGVIDLAWDAVPGAIGYLIYRSEGNNQNYTRLTPVHVTGTTYSDSGVTPGVTYYYRVTAVNADLFESRWSDEASASATEPVPGPPQNLVVTDPAIGNTLDLTWNPPASGNVAGYRIEYGTSSGNYDHTWAIGNVTSYRISGLINGQTYYFIVRARNSLGQYGPPSNEASGIPTRDGETGFPIIFPLLLTKQGNDVVMTWPQVTASGFIEYRAYRDIQKDLQRIPPNMICQIPDPAQTTCTDTNAVPAPQDYYYQVTFLDDTGEHQ